MFNGKSSALCEGRPKALPLETAIFLKKSSKTLRKNKTLPLEDQKEGFYFPVMAPEVSSSFGYKDR